MPKKMQIKNTKNVYQRNYTKTKILKAFTKHPKYAKILRILEIQKKLQTIPDIIILLKRTC